MFPVSTVLAVRNKKECPDPAAARVRLLAREAGLPVDAVACATLYRLEGKLKPDEIKTLGASLLVDPVLQEMTVETTKPKPPKGSVVVDVWLQPQVEDPVTASVARGAKSLGIQVSARAGQRFELQGKLTADAAQAFAWRALAHSVVHVCDIQAS